MNILDFQAMKLANRKISMVTCYDHWSAKIIASTGIDCVLVGDSVTMVMHGNPNTIPATPELIALHTEAVARGIGKQFIIADMPFLAHRKGLKAAMLAVEKIIRAGAHAVKIEGINGNEKLFKHIVESGIPVMGHIGMTAQAIHQLGGFRVQGKKEAAVRELMDQALKVQEAGCFAIVLECMLDPIAKQITEQLTIPTIGIGAGPDVDGQVLVFHDLLGLQTDFKPKFLKVYADGSEFIRSALGQYNQDVKEKVFPAKEHCY